MDPVVKQEIIESGETPISESLPLETAKPISVIDLSSSDSDSDESTDSEKKLIFDASGKKTMDSNCIRSDSRKKRKFDNLGVVLPHGFLDPLFPEEAIPLPQQIPKSQSSLALRSCKQFWKAGDYEGGLDDSSSSSFGGMDHVRVHPKFLHSNATSHKWALGAFAELLDNSLDEICHGVTFANIDMLKNKKDGSKMLLVEDNGGGMDPDRMRHCMSLGYSMKSKSANTIGQYGNGFKTSTMRLGADVIVFSRCNGQYGKRPTQSIGMLSYTFLRDTGKEDIVVPMLDYQKVGQDWNKMMRPSPSVWDRNVNTIVQWSPYTSEADLLDEFNLMEDQGTRVIIYNLWEDDQGELELDFDTDQHDIQIRGVNRDEKKIEMAEKFPNSKHFLTYRHSLRSYASILYLRIPPGFRIGLRGKDIEHHDIMNDMMLIQEVTYRPQPGPDGIPKDSNIFAVVNIGFVKDAKEHIDVQGFNVYHKNRLIKPFWRVWNAAGSDGRGVIGVLEANFVEPAHDKQGFERTIVLSRLEARLVQMQKTYWSSNCHKIGYAPRHKKKFSNGSPSRESSPNYPANPSSRQFKKATPSKDTNPLKNGSKKPSSTTSPFAEDDRDSEMQTVPPRSLNFNMDNNDIEPDQNHALNGRFNRVSTRSQSATADDARNGHKSDHDLKDRLKNMEESYLLDLEFERERCRLLEDQINKHSPSNSDALSQYHLLMENHELKEKLRKTEESLANDLQFERERCKSLEAQIMESERKLEDMDKEQEAIIEIFSEERSRRDEGEENLRKKVKDTSATIQELQAKVAELEAKVAELEKMRVPVCKQERET